MTAKSPSEAMIQTMPVTTADVAAAPTAEALRPHCMPRRQPASATRAPNPTLLNRPNPLSTRWTALRVS
jgi:hypothetical protein